MKSLNVKIFLDFKASLVFNAEKNTYNLGFKNPYHMYMQKFNAKNIK